MAQLLIKAWEDPNLAESPDKWKVGDLIDVWDDDHVFGAREQPSFGRCWIIRITGVSVATIRAKIADNPGIARRLQRIDVSLLSTAQRNALSAGPVTRTLPQLNAWLKEVTG